MSKEQVLTGREYDTDLCMCKHFCYFFHFLAFEKEDGRRRAAKGGKPVRNNRYRPLALRGGMGLRDALPPDLTEKQGSVHPNGMKSLSPGLRVAAP
jgi:hypothetical protein